MYLTLLLLVSFANAQSIRVQHRVVHPDQVPVTWSELGTVALPPLHSVSPLGSPATLDPSGALLDDLVDPTDAGAMYQVALERPGVTDDVWPTSVVKACHLLGSTSAHLTIHFSPSGLPFSVDHFVSPVPHDGSCSFSDTRKSYPPLNTTITLISPRQPLQPELRTPPPLTAEGEPIAPAPEKSFLQKYWIYIVIILGVLVVSGPMDEPAGNGGGQADRSRKDVSSYHTGPARVPRYWDSHSITQPMPVYIRPATKEDSAALSKICLETSDAGKSGRSVHNYPSLPGEVYALPYVNFSDYVWGFVLVEKPTENSPPSDQSVVGYTLGALDTRAFEAATAQSWWPPLKAKYAQGSVVAPHLSEADKKYIKTIMDFPSASQAQIAFSPAHLHIDILESYQRQGWGKRLIGVAIRHLKERGLTAVWLGMDPRNTAAGLFYERLGFHPFDGSPEGVLGITVEEWEGLEK